MNLRVELVNNLVEVVLHLCVLAQELLGIYGAGDILISPLLGLVRQLLEFVLLQTRLQVESILHLLFHILVLLKETLGVLAILQLLYLHDRDLVEQAQDSEDVLSGVVHLHLLEGIKTWIHYLRVLLGEFTYLRDFLAFSGILTISLQTLLKNLLGGPDECINVVKNVLKALLLRGVAQVDSLAIFLLILGEEVAPALFQINLALGLEADLLPEKCRFVHSNEVRERNLSSGLIEILTAIIQVEVVAAVLIEDCLLVLCVLQVFLVGEEAATSVHADFVEVVQTSRQVHVLFELLYYFVLCFSQSGLFSTARPQNELTHFNFYLFDYNLEIICSTSTSKAPSTIY